jgi:hypothetical protein
MVDEPPVGKERQSSRQPSAVEKLDAHEAAKLTVNRDNRSQTRSADQLRVSLHTDRKMKGQRQTITRRPWTI